MALAKVATGTGNRATGSSASLAVTATSPNLASTGPDVCAIIAVQVSVSTSSTNTTIASVTYGGTACTQIGSILLGGSGTARAGVALFRLYNPPTGVQNVVATAGGTSTKDAISAQVIVFSGVGAIGSLQTATASTHAPTSVAGGYVIRVLSSASALSSPNQTDEYGAGSSVTGGGDYVRVQSAAGTGSTISFTCSGATTPLSAAVALEALLPKIETFTDAFTSGANHSLGTGATVTGGQLRLESRADYAASAISVNQYSAADSSLTWELAQVPSNVGTYCPMGLSLATDHSDRETFDYNSGVLYMIETIASTEDQTSITYNATNHRWLQIEITGSTVNWKASPTGVAGSWTTLRTKSWAVGQVLTARTLFQVGGVDDSASAALIDNLNLPPTATAASRPRPVSQVPVQRSAYY